MASLVADLVGILGVSEQQATILLEASNHDLNRAAELHLTRGDELFQAAPAVDEDDAPAETGKGKVGLRAHLG